ncbi:DUF2384 domain-containing protein [Fibrella sp. HMF5405]|uniref:DUF2384 domain-containing protein n=2 Tax=Fibrella forsythiae TaxID=2817061 RepID=A0ABS3JB99_9BACT|nr:DUF2384 domain-containing protein [Fibrella forsythiae]
MGKAVKDLVFLLETAYELFNQLNERLNRKYLAKNGRYIDTNSVVAQQGEIKGLLNKEGLLYPTDDLSALRGELPEDELLISWREQLEEIYAAIKRYRTVLSSLESKPIPVDVPRPANFLKDNKLPAPADEDIERVRQNLPISLAQQLANILDITDKEMAPLLTISIRTYHRLKLNGVLNLVASERLLLLKDLAAYGLEVFEDQTSFNEWLRLPLQELSNSTPLSLLDTTTGIALVKTVLGRIDYGVYS